ncbi:MAG: PKD domain-containing protein, partial [Flavobacteriales bacterium]
MKSSKNMIRGAALIVLCTIIGHSLQAQTYNPHAANDYQNVFVDAGGDHTVALRCDGTVLTWGENGQGQLGDNNSPNDSNTPVQVVSSTGTDSLTDIIAVDAGREFTLALKNDGTVWAWGDGDNGQLGDGAATDSDVPVQVSGISNAVAIAAGNNHAMALLDDSTVVTWGNDNKTKLVCGGCGQQNTPVTPQGLDTAVIDIDANGNHIMALQVDGTVKTAGGDFFGQLGNDNPATDQGSFVYVDSVNDGNKLKNVIGITAGTEHSLALLNNGEVFAWGDNSESQLGSASAGPKEKLAIKVDNISNAIAIGAGLRYSIALLEDSSLMTWGRNVYGQLGLGDNTERTTPTAVSAFSKNVLAVAGGAAPASGGDEGEHNIVLTERDSFYTWGRNASGQLGNGVTGGEETTPVKVIDNDVGKIKAFAGNDTVVCVGDSVQLGRGMPPEDTSEFNYTWTPTTGMDNPNLPNPKVGSSSESVISYILTKSYKGANSAKGCLISDTVTVEWTSGIEADFDSDAPKCDNDSVDFVNTGSSAPSLEYSWDFGAGASPATDSVENPSGIEYSSPGLKTVELTVTDPVGCGGTATETKGITIHEEPNAAFNANPSTSCEFSEVDFNNNGSTGSKWNYQWDFGSGANPNSSTAENPKGIVYTTSGSKTVTFLITDDNGNCSDDTTISAVTVNES